MRNVFINLFGNFDLWAEHNLSPPLSQPSSYISAAIGILLALAFAFALMPHKYYETQCFMAAIGALTGAWVISLGRADFGKNFLSRHVRILAAFMAGFWLLAFVSVAYSPAPLRSFLYFIFFSTLPLTFFLTLEHWGNSVFRRIVCAGFALAFAALSLSAIAQYFTGSPWLVSGRVGWPLSNPNSLGGLISLGFFAAFAFMLGAQNRLISNAGLVLALLCGAAVLTSLSRGAIVAGGVGVLTLIFLSPAMIRQHWKCCLWLAAGLFAFAALMQISAANGVQTPIHIIGAAATDPSGPLTDRPAIWIDTLRIIKDHFWTGTGIGTFALYYPAYRSGEFETAGLMAHSDPLQFWAEMGLAAPLLFYGFILIMAVRIRRSLLLLPATDPRRIQMTVLTCGLGAMILHSHISFHFHILPILLFSGVILATVVHGTKDNTTAPRLPCAVPVWLRAGFAMLLLSGVTSFMMLQKAEIATDKARDAMMQGDLNTFAAQINRAGDWSRNRTSRALLLAASVPIGILEGNADTLSRTEKQALAAQAEQLLTRALAYDRRMAGAYVHLARLAMMDGIELASGKTTAALLQQALEINPRHEGALALLKNLLPRHRLSTE